MGGGNVRYNIGIMPLSPELTAVFTRTILDQYRLILKLPRENLTGYLDDLIRLADYVDISVEMHGRVMELYDVDGIPVDLSGLL